MEPHFLCHKDGVPHVPFKTRGNFLIGVDRVAVAAESADLQTGFLDSAHKLVEFSLIVQKNIRIAVILSGIPAAANLNHLHTHGFKIAERVLEGHIAHNIR